MNLRRWLLAFMLPLVLAACASKTGSEVSAANPVLAIQGTPIAATLNSAYSVKLTATGGISPYTWSISAGTLPAGVLLNSSTGELSGTPTSAGSFTFTIRVADSASPQQVSTLAVSNLVVNPAVITIATTSLVDGTVSSPYAATLLAAGGTTPLSWSVATGALPAGLALSAGGIISGTPTSAGAATFTARVTDSASPQNSQTVALTLTVRTPPPPALSVSTASLPVGIVGSLYSATLTAAGGLDPYSWSIPAGGLPAGLSISAAGVISGTPTSVGTATITVRVADSSAPPNVATRVLTLAIASPTLAVATSSLPGATAGNTYSAALAATGGTGAYSWSLQSGALPAGLTLSAGGTISGNPAAAGTASFTVRVTDGIGGTATRALGITVNAPALLVTTNALAAGRVGSVYNATLTASGGTAPFSWSVSVGALPAGLSLSAAGVISGTPTTKAVSSFTVQVADSGTPQQTRSRVLSLAINDSALSIVTGTLPDAVAGTAYSTSLAASGGATPYSWSIESGSLPAGLALSAAGVISGTPTAAGSSSVTIKVTDSTAGTPLTASASLTLTVTPPALAISTSALSPGVFGTAYSATLAATGGSSPYSWSISAGSLPAGLALGSDGVISGTPTTSGSSSFVVQVSDSQTPAVTVTRSLSLIINPAALAISTATLPAGQATVPYSSTLAGTGGLSPYTWSVSSGSLPPGLALGSAGDLTGTPTTAGSYSFVVQLRDAQVPAAVTTRALTLGISPAPLAITTATLPGATVGSFYSTALVGIGGTTPYSWTLVGGSLPAGLSLSAAGVISGTPTALVSSSFTVQLADSQAPAATVTRTLTLTTTADPLAMSTTALPSAAVGVPYTANLAATGGVAPYSWSVTGGSLPAGLSLSAAGVISGTPTAPGTASVTVQVADTQAPAATASRTLSLLVSPASLVISTTTLPDGAFSVAYNSSLAATGGTSPYSWSVVAGSLPAGLSLSAGGVLSGTPTAAGSSSFTIQVTDSTVPANAATRPYTLTIAAAALVIDTATLPGGTAGTAYGTSLSASGGTAPYSWSVVGGSLPAGLALASNGVISGTPTSAGTASFTVQVSDSQAPVHNTTRTLSISIAPAALVVSTSSLADGVLGSPYSAALAANGGTTPYAWVVSSGTLPAGLSLSSNGVISGTPTVAASSSFTVQVSDAQAPAAVASRSFTLVITPAALIITTSSVPGGQVGNAYNSALAVSGGTAPYIWSIVGGSLPSGLTLSAGGVISGTPTAAGNATFTVQVSDSQVPVHNTTQSYTMAISPPPLAITTTTLSSGQAGVPYSATLAVTGGTAPYSWSLAAGALPAGLSLSSGGVISGTPTVAVTASFSVQVVDSQVPTHNTSQALTLTIIPGPLSIATTSLAAGNAGSVYSATLSAAGGTSPYSWTLDSGSLPAGLALSSAGVISGTPSSAGSASFTVRVTDSQASPASVTRALTLQVNPAALVISTSALPNGATGTAYSTTLVASGGVAPYSWTIASGSLPAGLALDPGGVISGTPTAAVAASFTVRVTDSQGSPATTTRALTLTTTGSAQVFWTAPTLRDDTSNLTDLAGFKVYYGTSAGSLGNVQQVANPSATGVTISGLTAGTWFFAVTAYDSGNVESIRTTVVSGTVP